MCDFLFSGYNLNSAQDLYVILKYDISFYIYVFHWKVQIVPFVWNIHLQNQNQIHRAFQEKSLPVSIQQGPSLYLGHFISAKRKHMAQLMLDEVNLLYKVYRQLLKFRSQHNFCYLTPNMLRSKTSCWIQGSCFLQ